MTNRAKKSLRRLHCLVVMCLSVLGHSAAKSDVLIPPVPGDRLTATVDVAVTRNPSTGFYKYTYTITNSPQSEQSAWLFTLEILPDTTVLNPQSPPGWAFSASPFTPEVSWGAIGGDEGVPFDGVELPSPYQIEPGETLSGFSFESILGPADAQMYVQGWTPAPQATGGIDEFDDLGYDLDQYQSPFIAAKSPGKAPLVFTAYSGNRRPAVDGFIGYLNTFDRETRSAPVLIVGKYSLAGEVVYPETFRAELNGADITHLFTEDNVYGGDVVGNLTFENSNLVFGRNTLTITVEGLVPDTSRRANDADRITFFVE